MEVLPRTGTGTDDPRYRPMAVGMMFPCILPCKRDKGKAWLEHKMRQKAAQSAAPTTPAAGSRRNSNAFHGAFASSALGWTLVGTTVLMTGVVRVSPVLGSLLRL